MTKGRFEREWHVTLSTYYSMYGPRCTVLYPTEELLRTQEAIHPFPLPPAGYYIK